MAFVESSESLQEMEQLLREERIGYLGLSTDGAPYVIPLNYAYVDGTIIFHCARKGRKLDLIRADPRVSFTVGRQFGDVVPHPQGAICQVNSDSVVCTGVARIVAEPGERTRLLNAFNRRLRPDAPDIPAGEAAKCCAVEIRIEEMTGRRERNGKCVFLRKSLVG
jgi:nitroimidazol reductase NimA-like FMN-containing flavoprotein (pyridoxamine 5'-phosphate oxidase superfamily)